MVHPFSRLKASKKVAQKVFSLHKHFVPHVGEDASLDGQHHAHALSDAITNYFSSHP